MVSEDQSIARSFPLRMLHHVQNMGRITQERKRPGSLEHNYLFLICDWQRYYFYFKYNVKLHRESFVNSVKKETGN